MGKKKDNINSILAELQADILRITDFQLDKDIRDAYREEVEYMYDEYNPTQYIRRFDNKGFSDDTNWNTEININKRGNIEYILTNETETSENSPYRLDDIIEEGNKYTWKNSGIYKSQLSRPVYERTMDKLEKERIVEETLEKELKEKGW